MELGKLFDFNFIYIKIKFVSNLDSFQALMLVIKLFEEVSVVKSVKN